MHAYNAQRLAQINERYLEAPKHTSTTTSPSSRRTSTSASAPVAKSSTPSRGPAEGHLISGSDSLLYLQSRAKLATKLERRSIDVKCCYFCFATSSCDQKKFRTLKSSPSFAQTSSCGKLVVPIRSICAVTVSRNRASLSNSPFAITILVLHNLCHPTSCWNAASGRNVLDVTSRTISH